MNKLLLVFFLAIATASLAQSAATTSTATSTAAASDSVWVVVDQMPEFPGGINALGKFLGENMRYPKEARNANVQGKVFAAFVVGADGTIKDIAIADGIGSGCDEEVIRVLGLMPKWKPGVQKGEAVAVRYVLPVAFTLTGKRKK